MPYKSLLRVLISSLLIFLLIYNVNVKDTLTILKASNYSYLALSAFFVFLNIYISSVRTGYILSLYKYKTNLYYLTKLYLVGNFYNNFLPTQMGGDVYKAYKLSKYLKKESADKTMSHLTHASFAVFVDRLSGLLVLVAVLSITVFITLGALYFFLYTLLLILLYFFYNIFFKKYSAKFSIIGKLNNTIKILTTNKKAMINILSSALLVQVCSILSQVFCFYAIGVNINLLYSFLYFPAVILLGLVPSVNGIGVQDSAFVYFFKNLGILEQYSLASSILYHLIRLVTSLLGGGLVLFKKV